MRLDPPFAILPSDVDYSESLAPGATSTYVPRAGTLQI
jgi:hypothetical protein